MYDQIIVPFDGTRAANRAALLGADIATMADARLVVATSSAAGRGSALRTVKERAIRESDDRVTVWVEPAPSLTRAFATMLSYRPNALICMYTHARTGLLRSVYGNLAQTLLRVVDAPLLLIGPEWKEAGVSQLKHLIVCVDGSPASEAAIALAAEWAEMVPLDVTVLHVRTGDDDEVDLDRLAAPLERRCEIVDKLVVDDPDVVDGVLDVVRHSIEPFVVMATHARTGVDRLRHGSVVAELSAKCPVPILVQRGGPAEVRPGDAEVEAFDAGDVTDAVDGVVVTIDAAAVDGADEIVDVVATVVDPAAIGDIAALVGVPGLDDVDELHDGDTSVPVDGFVGPAPWWSSRIRSPRARRAPNGTG